MQPSACYLSLFLILYIGSVLSIFGLMMEGCKFISLSQATTAGIVSNALNLSSIVSFL